LTDSVGPSRVAQSWPRRHKILTTLGVIAALIIVGTIASTVGASSSGRTGSNSSGGAQPVEAASGSPAAQPTSMPAPVPSSDGKYSGSCDYTLGSDPVGGTAVFVGEST